jgi:murein DD-endopeptidase MepM/ murein hydrolase activator NlpD
MKEKSKIKSLLKKVRYKYRFIIYNDNTFEEVWYIRLSPVNLLAISGFVLFAVITIIIVLMSFTRLKELIPGYPSEKMRREIVENAIKLDSLEHELDARQKYLENFISILSGNVPKDQEVNRDTNIHSDEVDFSRSEYDSMLREQIENEKHYNLILNSDNSSKINFSSVFFFVPVKGIVTNSYNAENNHFGLDIVSGPNKFVSATLDGTVILSSWTLETGYVIAIQHKNNLISIYKHNAVLLKKTGDYVKAGEAISIIGNSGELTTGPHLHFELWFNGKPLNPEDYILF